MNEKPVSLESMPETYAAWLNDLKSRIHAAQQRASIAVNRELVMLYWQIGMDILAHDLRTAFPEMKGFSRANLLYMRAFAEAWPDESIVQQAVGQLPWPHFLHYRRPAPRNRVAAEAV